MRLLISLILMLLIPLSAAQTNNPQKLPISLTADSGEYDANADKATYTGNVVITQGEMKLTGDKVVISIKDGEVTMIESWGNLATFHYAPANEPPIDGKAKYLKYTIATSTVDMDKNAWVKQQKNETRAEHLSYNLKAEKIKGQRVNMTLFPKSN
ncbi:lipopolysaccharide transport periplasmic protein LptA [Suttonella ornithocola]|uniref:Lipopolysaccharide export system protein lptA n=1 Tax=Suttonella ornithocola TaxID=279832 RepID=A0A380MVE2_9GAMM|nr:lipopolysaccharide transport periplasmic protein LptA [Suttonella ornithocola]SUO95367.1 Lipopolysaccharide export system protein lptA precursor [Suttonella ornithocola]